MRRPYTIPMKMGKEVADTGLQIIGHALYPWYVHNKNHGRDARATSIPAPIR